MKKVLSLLLSIVLMSLLSIQAYAAANSEDDLLIDVNYETIEEEILKRNPTARMNRHLLQNQVINYDSDSIDASIAALNQAINVIDSQIASYETAKQKILAFPEGNIEGDENLINYIKSNFEAMIGIYNYNIIALKSDKQSLYSQIKSLEQQDENRGQTITNLVMQIEMSNDQLVWTAENLLVNYNNISYNVDELNSRLALLKRQLEISRLRQSLDMATDIEIESMEFQIMELEKSIKQLNEQKGDIAGEINLMLGQDYDTIIRVSGVPEPDYAAIDDMNLEEDLTEAIENNYTIIMQRYQIIDKEETLEDTYNNNEAIIAYNNLDDEKIKLENEKMKVTKAISKAFQEVKDNRASLEYERLKLNSEEKKLNISQLKYSLGMISSIDLESAVLNYKSQSIKVNTGEDELWKAYRKYEWITRGLTL